MINYPPDNLLPVGTICSTPDRYVKQTFYSTKYHAVSTPFCRHPPPAIAQHDTEKVWYPGPGTENAKQLPAAGHGKRHVVTSRPMQKARSRNAFTAAARDPNRSDGYDMCCASRSIRVKRPFSSWRPLGKHTHTGVCCVLSRCYHVLT